MKNNERRSDPTPAEIAERVAEVQSRWSEKDRLRRARGADDEVSWSPPTIRVNELGLPD